MALNPYLTDPQFNFRDQKLFNDLTKEAVQFNGIDVYYIMRDDGPNNENIDQIYKEDPLKTYSTNFIIEMYLDTATGFVGQGEIFSRFGWEVRDQAFFTLAKDRFDEEINRRNITTRPRPYESDLIYIPLTNDFFEIKYVEYRKPQFYQGGNYYRYMLVTDKFEYSSEVFNTGVPEIDKLNNRAETPNTIPSGDVVNTPAAPLSINDLLNIDSNTFIDTVNNNPFGSV